MEKLHREGELAALAQGLLCSSFLVGYGLLVSDYTIHCLKRNYIHTRVGVYGAYIDI